MWLILINAPELPPYLIQQFRVSETCMFLSVSLQFSSLLVPLLPSPYPKGTAWGLPCAALAEDLLKLKLLTDLPEGKRHSFVGGNLKSV